MKFCDCEQKTRDRFAEKVRKTDACWLWSGQLTEQGYGVVNVAGRRQRAHRFSYFLEYGNFDESLWVLHKCDVRACVRPDHLFLGTPQDNYIDMVQKGRAFYQIRDASHTSQA